LTKRAVGVSCVYGVGLGGYIKWGGVYFDGLKCYGVKTHLFVYILYAEKVFNQEMTFFLNANLTDAEPCFK